MIVVIATFEAQTGARVRVLEVARPCIEATRNEAGCLSYELFASTENDRTMVFVERWQNLEALKAHQQTAHIAAFKEARAPHVTGPSRVVVYEANEVSL